jgi:hypothetical protein
MPPKIAKLAGLGAFSACAGLVAVYLLLVLITQPSSRGGIDSINAAVAWISLGGLILALIVVHVAIGNSSCDWRRARTFGTRSSRQKIKSNPTLRIHTNKCTNCSLKNQSSSPRASGALVLNSSFVLIRVNS